MGMAIIVKYSLDESGLRQTNILVIGMHSTMYIVHPKYQACNMKLYNICTQLQYHLWQCTCLLSEYSKYAARTH